MSFSIRPHKEFLVRPSLPDSLSRLAELANNLLWVWDYTVRGIFRRLDPSEWHNSHHNPVLMLGRLSQATLEKASKDARFLSLYRKACERLDHYLQTGNPPAGKLIAYFSMEYGLSDCLPIYSGGLGILSGDHMKGASDLDLPLVGVGLLYQQGYFSQSINPDGWQIEKVLTNDFYTLPVSPVMRNDGSEMVVSVQMPWGELFAKVWVIDVGRIKLYLLDTNIPVNSRAEDRAITAQLYGGDSRTRIHQEIVLGLGGLRMLKELGLNPTVFHMNEGHSAFLAIERIRILMREHAMSFNEALEATRTNNVFTTHTSVPAGIDLFDPGLVAEYFEEYCRQSSIPFDSFMGLGRWKNDGNPHEPFSMAVLAIKSSCWRNAVSALHGEVSRDMWQELWPQLPSGEVPITHVTNGVHLNSWVNGDLAGMFDQYLQPDWRDRIDDHATFQLVDDIPDNELWETHKRRRRQLITFIRARLVENAMNRKASPAEIRRFGEVLDPEVLTIGFARRFATYKRATLFLQDVARLKRLLTNNRMPVQIVISGKAHPKDNPGKAFIREIVQLTRDPELAKRIVFVEDYSIGVARELVHGVDVWLNTPKRGEEACGTSGMKAAINGVLNLSILDGWYDEAYESSGGWAIGDRDAYTDDQDEMHASAIYSRLENEIVPMFYEAREDGVPHEWVRRVKLSLKNMCPQFDMSRMLKDYSRLLYDPAHEAFVGISADNFGDARQRVRWAQHVRGCWDHVRFVEKEIGPATPVFNGRPLPLRAAVDLAGLTPADVRVEAVAGRVAPSGNLEDAQVFTLPPVDQRGSVYLFATEFMPHQTGRLGYALRISSNHFADPLMRPCEALLKWG